MLLRKHRGIALLATMLAIALMTILVVDFTTSSALGYRSAANQADELRAYYLAKSGVAVGLAVLEQSELTNLASIGNGQGGNATPAANGGAPGRGYDSLDQAWALPSPPVPLDGGFVNTQIVDEDRKINLNRLWDPRKRQVDPNWVLVVGRLLANVGVSPDLLPILIDWLDPDSVETPGGAEADYYLQLMPPYEPRNGPMPTIYDLRMLKGMDDATFLNLRRFCTAMPLTQGAVNVNTAPPEVLGALAAPLENDPNLVKSIIEARLEKPFTSTADFGNEIPGLPQDPQFQQSISVSSTNFTVTGEGDFAGARKRIYATFKRITLASGVGFQLDNWHED